MIPQAIMMGAQILSNKNAQNEQTAQGLAGSLGGAQRSWDSIDPDELKQFNPTPNAHFGTFGG